MVYERKNVKVRLINKKSGKFSNKAILGDLKIYPNNPNLERYEFKSYSQDNYFTYAWDTLIIEEYASGANKHFQRDKDFFEDFWQKKFKSKKALELARKDFDKYWT